MLTSPGFAAGAWTSSCPTQPRFAAATSPRLASDRIRETTRAKLTARRRAMCSAWADAFGSWATAIEPYSSEMIYRNRKVNRLPLRRSPLGGLGFYKHDGSIHAGPLRLMNIIGDLNIATPIFPKITYKGVAASPSSGLSPCKRCSLKLWSGHMDSSPDFSVVTVIFLAATFAAALVAGLAGFAFGLVAAAIWLYILDAATDRDVDHLVWLDRSRICGLEIAA